MDENIARQLAKMAACLLDLAEAISQNMEANAATYKQSEIDKNMATIKQLSDVADELNELSIDVNLSEMASVVSEVENATKYIVDLTKKIDSYEAIVTLTLRAVLVGVTIKSGAGIPAIAKVVKELIDEGKKISQNKNKELV